MKAPSSPPDARVWVCSSRTAPRQREGLSEYVPLARPPVRSCARTGLGTRKGDAENAQRTRRTAGEDVPRAAHKLTGRVLWSWSCCFAGRARARARGAADGGCSRGTAHRSKQEQEQGLALPTPAHAERALRSRATCARGPHLLRPAATCCCRRPAAPRCVLCCAVLRMSLSTLRLDLDLVLEFAQLCWGLVEFSV